MKTTRLILAVATLLATACNCSKPDPVTPVDPEPEVKPVPTPAFAKGADISWVSEMEKGGRTFQLKSGAKADIMDVLKETGVNAIRLRVWVNPTGGWSGKDDVVKLATRAAKAGMALMVDFHYSDFFADPSRQTIPAAWEADKNLLDKMAKHVSEHTTEVLKALQAAGVTPNWVQVGNETRNGMLWPAGQLWTESGDIPDGRKHFARLLNAGYDAVKAVFPSCPVLAHLNHAYEDNTWWFNQIKAAGGKFDAIALSHYPQADNDFDGDHKDDITPEECSIRALSQIKTLVATYSIPVIISEIGVKTPSNESYAAQLLSGFMSEAIKIDKCTGVFYWEPEVDGKWKPAVYGSLGWNAYDMGAFTAEGKATSVMEAFK